MKKDTITEVTAIVYQILKVVRIVALLFLIIYTISWMNSYRDYNWTMFIWTVIVFIAYWIVQWKIAYDVVNNNNYYKED